ncbi:hypothetical protein, conserved [Eimeria brunetti]|uniref:Uncharacterized protein n=1 Tax=Eimeria brunetti TaxID=51314 RepID=U6LRM8_9EIME|nr:hypothetical protein, conserved [Eimeria brunetti]
MDARGIGDLPLTGEGSVLLEVAGELIVPSMGSKEALQDLLLAKKCVLDLRRTEIRMSDSVRREVYEALGLKEEEGAESLKRAIFLKGFVTNAPPGTNELIRCFLRKGTREQQFTLLRELARRRRAELERDLTRKGPASPPRVMSGEGAQKQVARLTRSAATGPPSDLIHGEKGETLSATVTAGAEGEGTGELKVDESGSGAAVSVRTGREGNNCLGQPYDEPTTFRSATTASEMGTFR